MPFTNAGTEGVVEPITELERAGTIDVNLQGASLSMKNVSYTGARDRGELMG